jgi:hypothetical protein
MKICASEKLALIDKVARELQSRYTFTEIDAYLAEFEIATPDVVSVNSKWVYSKDALKGVPFSKVSEIAEDLGIGGPKISSIYMTPPANWKDTHEFRLFVSHISKDKVKATRLKDCLTPYGIGAFVAHEDILPTLEWQQEIERALHCMDAFVAIHTPGFSASFWTQQEVGFAHGRGTKIISLRMGEDPTGFISKQQALPRLRKTAEQVAEEIDHLLSMDERTSEKLTSGKRALGLLPDVDEIPF